MKLTNERIDALPFSDKTSMSDHSQPDMKKMVDPHEQASRTERSKSTVRVGKAIVSHETFMGDHPQLDMGKSTGQLEQASGLERSYGAVRVSQEISPRKRGYFYSKRLMDISVSSAALVVLFPVLLIICLLIRLDSKGPIFFIQERIGKGGKPFNMIKFRTMYPDAEKYGPQWANKNDFRITRVGYFLRKYRLDETPQFINVVKGDMSLIGPRPERLVFVKVFEHELPHFRERLKVKPGITGWAQTNGGYELTPEEKLKLDLFYIENLSFLLDMKIVLQSIFVVLFAKGWR